MHACIGVMLYGRMGGELLLQQAQGRAPIATRSKGKVHKRGGRLWSVA